MHEAVSLLHLTVAEPFWPSSKVLGWFDSPVRISSLFSPKIIFILETPSCEFATRNSRNIKKAVAAAHLNAGVIRVVTV